jgi:hypothetical protein
MFFNVGNAKLTRRTKKLCQERNLPFKEVTETKIVGGNYYEVNLGYEVPDEIYNEVFAGIELEEYSSEIRKFANGQEPNVPISVSNTDICKRFGIPIKRRKDVALVPESLVGLVGILLALDRFQDQLQAVKDFLARIKIEEIKEQFRNKFPNASTETVDRYFRHRVYETIDDVPLDLLTANEIAELGLIAGSSSKVLISDDGATVTPLHYASLPKYQPSNDLADRVVNLGLTPQKALWIANKLIKIVASDRRADKPSYGYRFSAEDRQLAGQFHIDELYQIMIEEADRTRNGFSRICPNCAQLMESKRK